jgi:hypothetical protein
MFNGGTKNASYIANLLDARLSDCAKHDQIKLLTDIFSFDGAGNVQEGVGILTVIYTGSILFSWG